MKHLMKKLASLFLVIMLLSSCQSEYEFWELEKFNLQPQALSDSSMVQVLYYGSGPYGGEREHDFYSHVIAVSHSSGDTLNILTFPTSSLANLSPSNRNFVYRDHPIIENFDDLPEQMQELMSEEKLTWEKYDKVYRDPGYDDYTENGYPTVIGQLVR